MCSSWGFLAACFARIEKTSPDVVCKNRGNHRIGPLTSRKIFLIFVKVLQGISFHAITTRLRKQSQQWLCATLEIRCLRWQRCWKWVAQLPADRKDFVYFSSFQAIIVKELRAPFYLTETVFVAVWKKIRQNAVNNYETTIFLEFTTGNLLTETIFLRGQKKLRSSPPAVQINAAVRRYQPHPIAIFLIQFFFWARRRYINRSGLQQ